MEPHVVVPDFAGWTTVRMPVCPNVPYFELAPDWICEVISPNTSRLDRVRKMPIYAEDSVAFLWLIDPLARILEAFRLEHRRWFVIATHGGDERVRVEPFESIELDLARWWLPVESTG